MADVFVINYAVLALTVILVVHRVQCFPYLGGELLQAHFAFLVMIQIREQKDIFFVGFISSLIP